MLIRSLADYSFGEPVTQRLKEIIAGALSEFAVEKIILFGSYARGDNGPHSTIDILIVCQTDLSFFERIKKALAVTRGDPPVEPLLYTPAELDLLKNHNDGFMASIMEEGKVIYESQP